jgi:hypothetical protein
MEERPAVALRRLAKHRLPPTIRTQKTRLCAADTTMAAQHNSVMVERRTYTDRFARHSDSSDAPGIDQERVGINNERLAFALIALISGFGMRGAT